jgi:hypothetical protein
LFLKGKNEFFSQVFEQRVHYGKTILMDESYEEQGVFVDLCLQREGRIDQIVLDGSEWFYSHIPVTFSFILLNDGLGLSPHPGPLPRLSARERVPSYWERDLKVT